MIVPNLLRGVARELLDALTDTEDETSTLDGRSTVIARKTGIFGPRSRHVAMLEETGAKRSIPTVTAAPRGSEIVIEEAQVAMTGSVVPSFATVVPEITTIPADIEQRQVQATRTASASSSVDVTTIRTTALVIVDSSTTRTILTAAATTSATTRSPTRSPASTAASITTTVSGTATSTSTRSTDTATTTPSTPTFTSTSAPSAKTPIGAIAGGAVGGFVALLFALFLVAFLVRRHRKKIEKRRLEEANPFFPKKGSTPPPPLYEDRSPGSGGHQRSNSTSHDIYGTMGGTTSSSHTKFAQAGEKGRLIDMPSLQSNPAPGLRAEGGPGLPPAAFLRPAQMLDGRPINEIGGVERPKSVRSGKGSKFEEHIPVEMEDTSSFHAASPARKIERAPSSLSQDSPILGRGSTFSSSAATTSSLASDVARRQHLMSWSKYASDGDGEEMSATLNSSKAPPSARSSPSQVSPQSAGQLLPDSTYVISPLRKDMF